MLKKLLSHSAIYGLAPNIPRVVGILVLPILTQYLTSRDYGIAGTITAYLMAFSIFSTLGVNIVLTNSFYKSKKQYKWLWRQVYGFLQLWMIVFTMLQCVLLYFVMPEEALENRWKIIVLSCFSTAFFGATSLLGILHYRLLQKPIPIAIRSIISGLLTIVANIVFIVYLKMGYMGWFISNFISNIFINISYWWILNKKWNLSPIYNFKINTIKKVLKISLPTIPHYYSSYLLNTSNRLIMDKFNIPISQIGSYNISSQFGGYFEMFVNSINMAINPMCMEQIKNNREDLAKRIVYLMLAITLSSTFLFSLWSKEVFTILIKNHELQGMYPLTIILVMGYNYRPMYVASSNMFFYHEKTRSLLKVTTTTGILSFLTYIIVIPIYSIWGTAIVNYIFLMYMGYSGFLMKEYKYNTKVSYPFIQIFLFTIFITFSVFYLVEISIFLKVIISIISLFICIYYIIKINLK